MLYFALQSAVKGLPKKARFPSSKTPWPSCFKKGIRMKNSLVRSFSTLPKFCLRHRKNLSFRNNISLSLSARREYNFFFILHSLRRRRNIFNEDTTLFILHVQNFSAVHRVSFLINVDHHILRGFFHYFLQLVLEFHVLCFLSTSGNQALQQHISHRREHERPNPGKRVERGFVM